MTAATAILMNLNFAIKKFLAVSLSLTVLVVKLIANQKKSGR